MNGLPSEGGPIHVDDTQSFLFEPLNVTFSCCSPTVVVVVEVGSSVVVVVGGSVVVVVVDVEVVVVVGLTVVVVVVVGFTVVVVVVVGAAVVVVVDVDVVDVLVVVVDVVVVSPGIVVVVVVGPDVVVVVLDVVVGATVVVVVVVGASVEVVVVGWSMTGIVRMMSLGIPQVTLAGPRLSVTWVVSETMLSVTTPDAGAIAEIETSWVVNVAVAGSAPLPGENGPGLPYCIWFGWGKVVTCGVVVGAGCHCAGLDAGAWFRLAATIDL
jgi:hypothetical protein